LRQGAAAEQLHRLRPVFTTVCGAVLQRAHQRLQAAHQAADQLVRLPHRDKKPLFDKFKAIT